MIRNMATTYCFVFALFVMEEVIASCPSTVSVTEVFNGYRYTRVQSPLPYGQAASHCSRNYDGGYLAHIKTESVSLSVDSIISGCSDTFRIGLIYQTGISKAGWYWSDPDTNDEIDSQPLLDDQSRWNTENGVVGDDTTACVIPKNRTWKRIEFDEWHPFICETNLLIIAPDKEELFVFIGGSVTMHFNIESIDGPADIILYKDHNYDVAINSATIKNGIWIHEVLSATKADAGTYELFAARDDYKRMASKSVVVQDPCDFVECPTNGECKNGYCECEPGFEIRQCSKINPCDGVSCATNMKCIEGECVCQNGLFPAPNSGQGCVSKDPLCDSVQCPTNSQCKNGYCECVTGFEIKQCIKSCDGVSCAANMKCVEGDCECENGFFPAPNSGQGCVSRDPCASVQCTENRVCKDGTCECDGFSFGDNCACFPGSSYVTRPDGSRVQMSNVQVGDTVLTLNSDGNVVPDKVIAFLHWTRPEKRKSEHTFIKITSEEGRNITLSPTHLIQILANTDGHVFAYAGNVKRGDYLLGFNSSTDYADSDLTLHRVDSVEPELIYTGVYAPLTSRGTILVDGMLASCYSTIENHALTHIMLSPVRYYYIVKDLLFSEIYPENNEQVSRLCKILLLLSLPLFLKLHRQF